MAYQAKEAKEIDSRLKTKYFLAFSALNPHPKEHSMRSKLSVLAVILALVFTVIVFTKTKPINALTQDDAFNVSVVNKTRATRVTKATRKNGEITVAVKNEYTQRV